MLSELLDLLTDPAHLSFEVIVDGAFAGVGVLWHALWVRRHDAKEHPKCPLDAETAKEVTFLVPGPDGMIPARPEAPRGSQGPRVTDSKVYQTDTGPYEH